MGNYVFMTSFACLFLGMAFLIPAATVTMSIARRRIVRYVGMLTTAAALGLMGLGFVVDGALSADFALGNIVFAGLATYFAYETVTKAVAEYKSY